MNKNRWVVAIPVTPEIREKAEKFLEDINREKPRKMTVGEMMIVALMDYMDRYWEITESR